MSAIYDPPGGKYNDNLHELFFPLYDDEITPDYNYITVEQSIQAIDNYLENGKARWASILRLAEKKPAAKKR